MKRKNQAKEALVSYLSDPAKPWPSREELGVTVLGEEDGDKIYKLFTDGELSQIESQALDQRRKCYAGQLSRVDQGLFKKAEAGDTSAAKLVYQRFEAWAEKPEKKSAPLADISEQIQKSWEPPLQDEESTDAKS